MSLSFEESLKNSNEEMLATASFEQEDIAEEPVSIMAFSMRDVPMLLADNEGWTKSSNVNYKYYTVDGYSDEDYSVIDKNKNIILNQNQINITQESNSQYIPFQMPRRYDGFDLTNTTIRIYYVNRDKLYGWQYPVDVYYNDDTIKFAWLVGKDATAKSGELKFEIQAIGTNSKGEDYVWKSRSIAQLNVIQSLEEIAVGEIGLTQDQAESLYNAIELLSIQTTNAAKEANKLLTETKKLVDELKDGITQEVIDAIDSEIKPVLGTTVESAVSDKMKNYYTTDNTYNKGEVDAAITSVNNKFGDLGTKTVVEFVADKIGNLGEYEEGATIETVVDYITEALKDVDISAALGDIGTKEVDGVTVANTVADFVLGKIGNLGTYKNDTGEDVDIETVVEYVTEALKDVNIDNKLGTLTVGDVTYNTVAEFVNAAVANVDVSGKLTNYVTTETFNPEVTKIDANTANITNLQDEIDKINDSISKIEEESGVTYKATYGAFTFESGETSENIFTLWTVTDEGESPVSQFEIKGGSGGGEYTGSSPTIERVTGSPCVFNKTDKALIYFNYTNKDSSGEPMELDATIVYKVGTTSKNLQEKRRETGVFPSENLYFDATKYLNEGDQIIKIELTDGNNSFTSQTWRVKQVDLSLEANLDGIDYYPVGSDVTLYYTANGDIEDKYVHIVLDNTPLCEPIKVSSSGRRIPYVINSRDHGAHLLEVYMISKINDIEIPSEHYFFDIIWYDENNDTPIIGCSEQNISMNQYDTTEIEFTVYDAKNSHPTVSIYDGDNLLDTKTLASSLTSSYKYKAIDTFDGEETSKLHVLKIVCGDEIRGYVEKEIKITVNKIIIEAEPVIDNIGFDFNPVGYSNDSANRIWSYGSTKMIVPEDFDWVNGGYKTDENGDQFFCVKAGNHIDIDYKLFDSDPKTTGKEFKIIFKTENVKDRSAKFLSCADSKIGLEMFVEKALVTGSDCQLVSHYCENNIIEYEFNINKTSDSYLIMSYEDGTPSTPCEYSSNTQLHHIDEKNITIGSDDCDIHIYRMKAYKRSLTNKEVVANFICDARNAEEMIKRDTRNRIYNSINKLVSTSESGDFSAEDLMKSAPDLRYIFLEAPHFTNDKDTKVHNCKVYFRYPAGTRPEDNWTCTGVTHKGQGTSSNEYGDAGRNIDIVMDNDDSMFEYTGENGETIKTKTITLSDTSIPTDYLNIKVNIASSENANNAEMARRYNEYQPFLRYARKKNSNVKDTMEFYNCVVFIRETSTDEANFPHREFNDTNWHFYAIGNVGDSKKTDDTRVNNKNDEKEFVVEIMDVDKPLANFPTGKDGNEICSLDEWCAGNAAYDTLYSPYGYNEKSEFESFGNETFEFRYESKKVTNQNIRDNNINIWRDFYKFVVTSTDSEFYNHLKDYFVVESALYYYLFTERYTMVDNRAKNSFWHYGKVYISTSEATTLGEEANYYIIDDAAAAINEGYRFDLTFGYDFDTCLGIDNTGNFVFQYGKEDTDYYADNDHRYVFRAHDSTFFCRLRDLFSKELMDMYQDRDKEVNAWGSSSLIKQWDESQAKFPEELWREDFERKYYRPYCGESLDNSIPRLKKEHLTGKFFGRKKYSRRAFETNQEVYMGSKYFGSVIIGDNNIYFRGTSPENVEIKPNYTLRITPYIDMYIVTRHSSAGQYIRSELPVKAGKEYIIKDDALSRDFIYIYGAAYIQAIGDLSRCYIEDNDFTKASRIQKLVIGNNDPNYENPYMTKLAIGKNPLLEYVDIRGVTGINNTIDFSYCNNLKEVYAERSGVTGIIFADGGLLKKAYLPKLEYLTVKNLKNIEPNQFRVEKHVETNGNNNVVDEYYVFRGLTIENTPLINSYEFINKSRDYNRDTGEGLLNVRLTGLNWDSSYNISDSDILHRIKGMRGYNNDGSDTEQSVVNGSIYVQKIKQRDLEVFGNLWPDLDITYDPDEFVYQHKAIFLGYNDEVLEIQYVDDGYGAVSPNITPTKPSTLTTTFEFKEWDKSFLDIREDRYFRPIFTEKVRKYKIVYKSGKTESGKVIEDAIKQNVIEAEYGSYVSYQGVTPVYTGKESSRYFYLFNRWDKSGLILEEPGTDTFYDNDTKEVYAIFDEFHYTTGSLDGREQFDFTPVEIYAIKRLVESGDFFITDEYIYRIDENNNMVKIVKLNDIYELKLGRDFEYDDVDSIQIVGSGSQFGKVNTIEFNGQSDYFDTEIPLFKSNDFNDFVLAIDYEFNNSNNGSVIAQCYKEGLINDGLRLQYDSGVKIKFGSTNTIAENNSREMVVFRYISSENKMHIYTSNLDGTLENNSFILNANNIDGVDSTLVFGANKKTQNSYANFAKGKIYWAKLWKNDIGDHVCRELSKWPHEKIGLKVSGFQRYYKQGGESLSSISFLATDLLDKKMKMNSDGGYNNDGGWTNSYLNQFLNSKFYESIQDQVKTLIEPVIIRSTVGSSSTSTDLSLCYVTIPSLKDLDGGLNSSSYANNDGYKEEAMSYIAIIKGKEDRKRGYDNDPDSDDNAYYWTRTPYIGSQNRYYWRVSPDGSMVNMGYTGDTKPYKYGVLIEISF